LNENDLNIEEFLPSLLNDGTDIMSVLADFEEEEGGLGPSIGFSSATSTQPPLKRKADCLDVPKDQVVEVKHEEILYNLLCKNNHLFADQEKRDDPLVMQDTREPLQIKIYKPENEITIDPHFFSEVLNTEEKLSNKLIVNQRNSPTLPLPHSLSPPPPGAVSVFDDMFQNLFENDVESMEALESFHEYSHNANYCMDTIFNDAFTPNKEESRCRVTLKRKRKDQEPFKPSSPSSKSPTISPLEHKPISLNLEDTNTIRVGTKMRTRSQSASSDDEPLQTPRGGSNMEIDEEDLGALEQGGGLMVIGTSLMNKKSHSTPLKCVRNTIEGNDEKCKIDVNEPESERLIQALESFGGSPDAIAMLPLKKRSRRG
jgi:hypothetical protein